MTNLAHWHDDIDDALVGDFGDGSPSSLCIMSLSFDFSRNGAYGGTHFNSSYRDVNNQVPALLNSNLVACATTTTTTTTTTTPATSASVAYANANTAPILLNTNASRSIQDAISNSNANAPLQDTRSLASSSSSATLARLGMNQDSLNEFSMHAFKRFKSSLAIENNLDDESQNSKSNVPLKSNNQSRSHKQTSSRQPIDPVDGQHNRHFNDNNNQQLAYHQNPLADRAQVNQNRAQSGGSGSTSGNSNNNRNIVSTAPESPSQPQSPDAISTSNQGDDDPSSPDDSTRTSMSDPRSPSRSHSCSSISTQSHTISSRSQSPSDMSIHPNNNNKTKANDKGSESATQRNRDQDIVQVNHNAHNNDGDKNGSISLAHQQADHQSKEDAHVSNFSVRDSLLNSHKDNTTYSASGIIKPATSTPMHFKGMHHPFSLRQFPSSPYHQFSNSSFNHDFYDRYLSHDSHQPLQTPLIGIERTQDLLSLKFPAHGPDDADSQRFSKEWPFEDPNKQSHDQSHPQQSNQQDRPATHCRPNEEVSRVNYITAHQSSCMKRKDFGQVEGDGIDGHKDFQFSSYKSSQQQRSDTQNQRSRTSHGEPIDLNVSYDQAAGCCDNNDRGSNGGRNATGDDDESDAKDDMFNQSMKHFNPERAQLSNCCDNLRPSAASSGSGATSSNKLANQQAQTSQDNQEQGERTNLPTSMQYQSSQESMFGIDSSKQKFQYALAAPISVATKFNEDTMTYLNQGQAYEIKLENMTDESKKGFMCSIINIGFQERHMQQAENELWQQWSQQHPNEKIFSVDMKLSYNVFGVESDGLNKCEFLWDSSKVAGVFIRINSISTEFTPRKHGGEKGVPFKLSIETFSYNSKTHDSYFISAACCQIKVFKPKGAERKIRSDRDKISKRPLSEQEKYHRPCDQTIFRECSLTSLHPLADSSLCYYRHSHGHFASKQVGAISNVATGTSTPANMQQANGHQTTDDNGEQAGSANQAGPQSNQSSGERSQDNDQSCRQQQSNIDNGPVHDEGSGSGHQKGSHDFDASHNGPVNRAQHHSHHNQQEQQQHTDHFVSVRPIIGSHFSQRSGNSDTNHANENSYNSGAQVEHFGHQGNDLLHTSSSLNQIYQSSRASLVAGVNNGQHFGMNYQGHTSPPSLPSHIAAHPTYSIHGSNSLNSLPHSSHAFPSLAFHQQPSMASMKSYSGRQLANDPKLGGSTASHCQPIGSFKTTHSLPATTNTAANNNNNSNNYSAPAHFNIHTDQPCLRQHHVDYHKDPLNAYHSESTYESHLQQLTLNTNVAHNNQVTSCRQRSASTSVAPTSAHCTNYMATTTHGGLNHHHHAIGRYQDSYHVPMAPGGNSLTDSNQNAYSSNHWSHGHQTIGVASNNSNSSSNNNNSNNNNSSSNNASTPARNSCIQSSNQHTETGYHNQTGNNYSLTAANHGYDSDHNSTPQKTHQIPESPISCCAKPVRANSSSRLSYEFSADRRTSSLIRITASSTHTEVNSWFIANRFNSFAKTFNNFSGSDLLRLAKSELIEICGLLDGIRLYNCLHDQPIKPRRVLYVSLEDCDVFQPIYLYEVTLKELVLELTKMCNAKCRSEDRLILDEKPGRDKSSLNSNSSSDSRSSIGAISSETGVEEAYGMNEQYMGDRDRCGGKRQIIQNQKTPERGSRGIASGQPAIKRLLIEGLTSVRILATEQVIQMLDNDSAWVLTINSRESTGCLDACLTACRPKQFPK